MPIVEDAFRSVAYPLRLHAGYNALRQLRTEVERTGRKRAFAVCGRSVAGNTNLLSRIETELGDLYAGAFTAMDKDSSWPAVEAATAAARHAQADLLVAVGGGSVIVGTRVVAILLAEDGDPFELMTQYPAGKPAYSPRLAAPKPPIVNVVTTPTSAMNRAGSGLRNDKLGHRMEYYDPKTRPVAIFWDADALLSAPAALVRSTAATGFCSALRALASPRVNPLVEADRSHAFRLLHRSLPRIMTEPGNVALRIDLCAAALLENRAADDDQGRRRERDQAALDAYALATALHVRYDHVPQGESTTAVVPSVTRMTPPKDIDGARRIAQALGAWQDGMDPGAAAQATAQSLETLFRDIGMPTRVRELGIAREDLALLAREAQRNFNANPGQRADAYAGHLLKLLHAAW